MTEVYILMPAFSLSKLCESQSDLFEEIKSNLGNTILANSSFFELMPFEMDSENDPGESRVARVALRMKSQDFSLNYFESLIFERKTMESQLEIFRSALESLDERQFSPQICQDSTISKLQEENSKLKSLLKSQLENAEHVRRETQRTVKTLKSEFDYLVSELSIFPGIRPLIMKEKMRAENRNLKEMYERSPELYFKLRKSF